MDQYQLWINIITIVPMQTDLTKHIKWYLHHVLPPQYFDFILRFVRTTRVLRYKTIHYLLRPVANQVISPDNLWVHVGPHKTGTTTLQKIIFPYHPDIHRIIPYTSLQKQWINRLFYYWGWTYSRLLKKVFMSRDKVEIPRLGVPCTPHTDLTTPIVSRHKRPKCYLISNEVLSAGQFWNQQTLSRASLTSLSPRPNILYVLRKPQDQLHSLYSLLAQYPIHYASSNHQEQWNTLEFTSVEQFADLARQGIGGHMEYEHYAIVYQAAYNHVYQPRFFLEQVLPKLGRHIHVLVFEQFQQAPKDYLDALSERLGIDKAITWQLYNGSTPHPVSNSTVVSTRMLMPESHNQKGMGIRLRGYQFYQAFKRSGLSYQNNPAWFAQDLDAYQQTLDAEPLALFNRALQQIKQDHPNARPSEILLKLTQDSAFRDWLVRGEKLPLQFSKATLDQLHAIRAPQNRWIAQRFNLDLAQYGYVM